MSNSQNQLYFCITMNNHKLKLNINENIKDLGVNLTKHAKPKHWNLWNIPEKLKENLNKWNILPWVKRLSSVKLSLSLNFLLIKCNSNQNPSELLFLKIEID